MGAQKPGFFTKKRVAARTQGKKPGFEESECVSLEFSYIKGFRHF